MVVDDEQRDGGPIRCEVYALTLCLAACAVGTEASSGLTAPASLHTDRETN